jgi:hypothetical protein
MSLEEFQCVFADLISSPERSLAARSNPDTVLTGFDLTQRERRRLTRMVCDPGMSINCTLFRVNRLTPVYSVLPLTCAILGHRLLPELEAFWDSCEEATLQYRREAWRFGRWLQERITSGILQGGPIEDAIQFELAAFDVRIAPRHTEDDQGANEHPRRRFLRFTYDPCLVLDPTTDWTSLEPLPHQELILLDATGGYLEVYRLRGMSQLEEYSDAKF